MTCTKPTKSGKDNVMNILNVYLSTIDINERERELFLYIKSWQQCFSASSKSVMSDKAQLYADFFKSCDTRINA